MSDSRGSEPSLSQYALLGPLDVKTDASVTAMLETLSEAVISVDKEPGVIDNEMIRSAFMKNVPIDTEPGKLMHADGVKFRDIEELKLEFYDILRIDHLWMCSNLRSLSLSNNIIEELANLESLVNLEELNLSFNRIKEISGLRALTKLENLSLFNNRITKLENLEGQMDTLRIFSLGRNLIESADCLVYLRKFPQLRSLNLEGNPFIKAIEGSFSEMVAGMLPRLVYYRYEMLTTDERNRGREKLKKKLKQLEEEEESQAQWKKEFQIHLNKVDHYQKAFIEGYDKWDFFNKLMSQDQDGQLLMKVSDDVLEVFTTLKDTFTNISKNILTLGIQCYGHRQNEQKIFHHSFAESMEKSVQESQVVIRDFITRKNKLLEKLQTIFERPCISEGMAVKNMKASLLFDKDFTFVRRKVWWDLMDKEMKRFEGNEESLSNFEDKMIKLVGKFREKIQEEFGKMRDAENEFYEALADQINKYLVELHGKEERSAIPDNLKRVLFNKENLNNSIGTSHENHLLTIDTSEEKILNQLNNWQVQLAARLYKDEVRRNRDEVLEIDRFLSFHKADWERQVGEQIKAAFTYVSTVDPEWSHEIMRLKMNHKERLLDDQMQAMMAERMQQSLRIREDDRLEELEKRRRMEEELEDESEEETTQQEKRSARRKRPAQLHSESQRPATFLEELKTKLRQGLDTSHIVEFILREDLKERDLARQNLDAKRKEMVDRDFKDEEEDRFSLFKAKGSVRKFITRFAYRCLLKIDAQMDTIYQHWSSAEDLSF